MKEQEKLKRPFNHSIPQISSSKTIKKIKNIVMSVEMLADIVEQLMEA